MRPSNRWTDPDPDGEVGSAALEFIVVGLLLLVPLVYLVVTLVQKLFFGIDAPGYASLLVVLLFFNGLLMISNGIQGEYIARIFEEVKNRPLYVVGEKFGFEERPVVVDVTPLAPVKPHKPVKPVTEDASVQSRT